MNKKYVSKIKHYFENIAAPHDVDFDIAIELIEKYTRQAKMNMEEMFERYDKYVVKWKVEHYNQDSQYLKKDQVLMDFYTFVTDRHFYINYSPSKSDVDKYIFGNYDPITLESKLKELLVKLKLKVDEPVQT